MQFEFKGIKVKISFTFFAVYLLFIGFSNGKLFLYSVIAAVFHELVHSIFIVYFKAGLKEFSLSATGGNIIRDNKIVISDFKEAVISLSAPIFNIILGLVLVVVFPDNIFGTINIIMGVFNLLPFYCFDGGRGLKHILSPFLKENQLNIILTAFSVIVTAIISALSIYIFFNDMNPLMLVTALFMLVSLVLNIYKHL